MTDLRGNLERALAHRDLQDVLRVIPAVLLHQPVDAFGVDRGQTVGSPLAL